MSKKYKPDEPKSHVVNDNLCEYQKKEVPDGTTRFITQEELDKECMTVEKSRTLLLEKVHTYFHHS